MTTLADRYEGNFLEAIDLPEGALVPVEIAAVVPPDTEEDARKKLIKKAILTFGGKEKRFILNKTNYRLLKILVGPPSDWIGGAVNIQRRYLPANRNPQKQKNEPCIRIIPPEGTPIPKSVRDFMGTKLPID